MRIAKTKVRIKDATYLDIAVGSISYGIVDENLTIFKGILL